MKIKTFILALIVLIAGNAQSQNWFGGSYSTSVSSGNLHDYVSKYSWQGISLDYRVQTKNKFLVGVTSALNLFHERKDYASYTYETITASGVQYRNMTAIPIIAVADYADTLVGKWQWFAGIGIGTTYLYRYTDFGSFTFTNDTWQFLLSPELGLSYPITEGDKIFLSARYNQNFKNKEMNAQPYFSINIGFMGGF